MDLKTYQTQNQASSSSLSETEFEHEIQAYPDSKNSSSIIIGATGGEDSSGKNHQGSSASNIIDLTVQNRVTSSANKPENRETLITFGPTTNH